MQARREGARPGAGGQPPLQTRLWRQDHESAGGGGAAEEMQVWPRPSSHDSQV